MARGAPRTAVSGGLVTGFVLVFLALHAVPAAAVDDPTRPDARVTHGPSCRPGGLVVEVVAGTAPYFVRLATTRQPAGEDEATLQPGAGVTLRTDDVAWGETIDGRLEYTAGDGSGATFVDELDTYSFTRPTQADCEAIASPSAADEPPATSPSSTPEASAEPGEQDSATTDAGAGQPSAPSAGTGEPAPSGLPSADRATPSAGRPVTAGGTVTLVGAGFLPGERVVFQLHGTDTVLGSATARPDGTVRIELRIPDRTATGPATVDLMGNQSELSAGVELRIAGHEAELAGGMADLIPLVTAAAVLVATVGGLVSVAGRQRAVDRGAPLRRA
jgi:uncharacterized iron-regulated membrane protein